MHRCALTILSFSFSSIFNLSVDCNTQLARHRAALEAGADRTIVTGWIAEGWSRAPASPTSSSSRSCAAFYQGVRVPAGVFLYT